ncbi:MAG TPA: peptidylprolyl isomerase [Polyangiaceae bacterium]|nr:peptidylprolyl isomerase [Polyangiaceae bacterium]
MPFQELNRTFLWVSHVVIAYDEASPKATALRTGHWSPDPVPVAQRSKSEALRLANKVQQLAQEDPSSFTTLARIYSDDIVTKDHGGSLGGMAAAQLPPEFVDALATMQPGQVSRIVATPFGFHVLKRNPVPPAGKVAGQRVLIAYFNEGRHGVVQNPRSHTDARILAEHVADVARSGRQSFESLVEEYSDDYDKMQAGDVGVWSVRDPGSIPREVERLASLADGETSDPIDTATGFVVLRRVPVTSREEYAMRALRFGFDPTVTEGTSHSRAAAAREAALFARAIMEAPLQFEQMLREQCCTEAVQWTDGRGPVGVTPVIAALRIGEIAKQPVLSPRESAFIIPQRLDPRSASPLPEPRYELPGPTAPDLEALVRRTDRVSLARSARLMGDELPKRIALAPAQRVAFVATTSRLATAFEADPDVESTKVDRWRAAVADIRATLSPREFTKFELSLNEWVNEKLMENVP